MAKFRQNSSNSDEYKFWTEVSVLNKNDLLQLGRIAVYTAVAWTTPPSLWRKIAAAMPRFNPSNQNLNLLLGQRTLGPAFNTKALSTLDEKRCACGREARLQILGSLGPWRSWRPDIRLCGEANLQKALDNGRGAILWVTDSYYSTLIFKMALHHAGYQACQLSRPQHGFSTTPFGISFLNPLWCRVEDRFIAERVLIEGDNAAPALAILRARLAANRVVIITITSNAHRFVEVPFFHHQIRLPTGPIRLAQEAGTALLPGFAFAPDNGSFEVTIDEPLPVCNKQNAFASVATSYAKCLEPFIKKYPDQWTGWDYLLSQDAPSELAATS